MCWSCVLANARFGVFCLVFKSPREIPWKDATEQQRRARRPCRCQPGRHSVACRARGPGCRRARGAERPQQRLARGGPRRRGVLRAALLLLHLWLRIHQQRKPAGSHERARGRDRQHHPEQGRDAPLSAAQAPAGPVTPRARQAGAVQ